MKIFKCLMPRYIDSMFRDSWSTFCTRGMEYGGDEEQDGPPLEIGVSSRPSGGTRRASSGNDCLADPKPRVADLRQSENAYLSSAKDPQNFCNRFF